MLIRPIGPQPVTTAVWPATSSTNAAWTALPSGSWSAAISGASSPRTTQALTSGMTTYSANAPGTCTPRMRMFWQTWARPVRHW